MSRSWTHLVSALLIAALGSVCAVPAAAAGPDAPLALGYAQPMPAPNGAESSYPTTASSAPTVVDQPYFDLDAYLDNSQARQCGWHWQVLPGNLIYKSYLAGVKEPRLGTWITHIKDDARLWEGVAGARIGLLRYGDHNPLLPQGFQIDLEGAANVRLDVDDDVNVRSTDYRVGVPFTYGWGSHQWKLAYYHMSSHLGDEFVLSHPDFDRLNWSRDALVLGYSNYVIETLRLYVEAGWAFRSEISEPWELQFGADWAPNSPTGFRGAPFFAINGHLRQEVNYGGNLSIMTGWAWLSTRDRRMMRLGLQYYNGKSSQYSFYNNFEEQFGVGVWYDF